MLTALEQQERMHTTEERISQPPLLGIVYAKSVHSVNLPESQSQRYRQWAIQRKGRRGRC